MIAKSKHTEVLAMSPDLAKRSRVTILGSCLFLLAILSFIPGIKAMPPSLIALIGLLAGSGIGWLARQRALVRTLLALPPPEDDKLREEIGRLKLENEKMFEELGDQERSIGKMAASVRQRSISELAETYGLSLRNVLSYSESLLTVLMDKLGADPSFRQWVDRLEKEVQPVSTFCESSLTIAASRESNAERLDLNSLVVRVAGLLAAQFDRGGVQTKFELAESIPQVRVLPFSLCTALVDILGNSVGAVSGRRNAQIVFKTFMKGGKIVLEITDSRAISRINLSRVFSATPLNHSRMFEGRYGYSVVKVLMAEQKVGVDVLADSGRDFTSVVLEFEEAPSSLREASALNLSGQKLLLALGVAKRGHFVDTSGSDTKEEKISLKNRKFMVVDADREVTALASKALEDEGALVEKVHDIGKARVSLMSGQYDLIITDYKMSGMNPEALMSKLLYQKIDLGSRIIFLALREGEDEIKEFLEEFKYPVLEKPFDGKSLVKMVSETLQRRQLKKAS